MIIRSDSLFLRVLQFIASPTHLLPALIPLWVERARIGTDTTSYVRVTLRRK